MEKDIIGVVIGGVSAFAGALTGAAILAWWLASRFNNVYTRIHLMETAIKDKIGSTEKLLETKINDHEAFDIERFAKHDLAIMRIELLLQGNGKSLHRI